MYKSEKELGDILGDMYRNAPRKEVVTMVHLFGIQYHEDIRQAGVKEVVRASGIGEDYKAEVNKGIKLAKYVTIITGTIPQ